jgi:hypothetical protein
VQEDTQKVIDGEYKRSQEELDLGMDKPIFHALLESDLPSEEKLHSRIWQEGQIIIGAGAETTAQTLTTTHFHILDNPDVLKKLRAELEVAMPDQLAPAKLAVVEHLPYLVTRILPSENEPQLILTPECGRAGRFKVRALLPLQCSTLILKRLSYGFSTRLQRSHPFEIMKFRDWEIPPGVSLVVYLHLC